jgi:hypothetical protein
MEIIQRRHTGGASTSTAGTKTGPVPSASATRAAEHVDSVSTRVYGYSVAAREVNRTKLWID